MNPNCRREGHIPPPKNPFGGVHDLRGLGDNDAIGLTLRFLFPIDAHDAGIAVPGKSITGCESGALVTRAMNHMGVRGIFERRAGDGPARRIHGLTKTGFRRLDDRLLARLGNGWKNIIDIRTPVHGSGGVTPGVPPSGRC